MWWCCGQSDDPQREPLIEDTLIPRLTELARTHKTLYGVHAHSAERFTMLGQVREAAEAADKAEREHRYYQNVAQLKRLLEDSRLVLDGATGLIAWNAEVGALLAEMPKDVGAHFAAAADQ